MSRKAGSQTSSETQAQSTHTSADNTPFWILTMIVLSVLSVCFAALQLYVQFRKGNGGLEIALTTLVCGLLTLYIAVIYQTVAGTRRS